MLKRSMIHGCYAYSYPETLAASGFQENLKNFEQHLSILWDEHKIRPMIPCRELWREEKKNDPQYDPSKPVTRSLFPDRVDTIVYTEKGTVHCVCLKTGIQRDLAFQGFEDSRNTLKYRCPAAAYGLNCEGKAECHCLGGVLPGEYGRIVRINITKENRRKGVFT